MPPRDGDGFVMCRCGRAHWGRFGAAGLLLVRRDLDPPHVLLQLRAAWTHDGGTWALPGGAIDSHEDERAAAVREAGEEAGIDAADIDIRHVFVDDHGDWRYVTVIAFAEGAPRARAANQESDDMRWVPLDSVSTFPLHPGFAASWPDLAEITATTLLG